MNIIHIDEKSHKILDNWIQKNVEYERLTASHSMAYFNKCELDFGVLTAYVEHNSKRVKINVKTDKLLLKMKIVYTPNGENEYAITYDVVEDVKTKEGLKQIQDTVKMIASDYFAINALFYFGNIVDTKSAIAVSRTNDKDKHYFVKGFEDKIYVVNSSYHKSPQGVFSVRGHFRKYKNGKIIWIDEFLKGTK